MRRQEIRQVWFCPSCEKIRYSKLTVALACEGTEDCKHTAVRMLRVGKVTAVKDCKKCQAYAREHPGRFYRCLGRGKKCERW